MRGSLGTGLLLALLGCEIDVDAMIVEDVLLIELADADLLFVVDDSNSMAEAQALVASEVGGLTSAFTSVGLSWRAAVTTTDISSAARRGRFLSLGPGGEVWTESAVELAAGLDVGVAGSNLKRGLEAAWYGLTPPLATHDNDGFRREGARLVVVVVSDEDDCSDEGALVAEEPSICTTNTTDLVDVETYGSRFRDLVEDPSDFGLWAIVETGVTAEHEGCGGTTPGSRYVAVARATAGEVAPLCGDMGAVMREFGEQMRGERAAVRLSRTPLRGTLVVEILGVDGTVTAVPEDLERLDGWTFFGGGNTVRLWGSARPVVGESVVARYEVGIVRESP
jgi:hypothetical protein